MITIRPRPKLFSSHHNLVLDADEQTSLDTLFNLDPLLDDERELIHQVIRAGIKAMNQRAESRDPHLPTRTEVTAAKVAQWPDAQEKLSLHFPKRIELDLTNEQRDGLDNLANSVPHVSDAALVSKVISVGFSALQPNVDVAYADSRVGAGSDGPKMRSVENYLGVPILEGLRQRLEEFLADCPDVISDEQAFAMLLDLGLQHAEGRPPSQVIERVKNTARRRGLMRRGHLHRIR